MKKKQKTTSSGIVQRPQKQKSRRNALHYIKDMPLDILYEIFCLLTPHDLLRLSRTSKDLRKNLMSKSSLFVWKACRKNSGVPDPLPSMSEPAFARLVFDPHCHFCLTAVVQIVSWETMVRCCNKCFDSVFKTEDEIEEEIFDEDMHYPHALWDIFPQYHEQSKSKFGPTRALPSGFYLVDAIIPFLMDFQKLADKAQRKIWLAKKVEDAETRTQCIKACRAWERTKERQRERERINAKTERFRAIMCKLMKLGWKDELRLVAVQKKLQEHKLVNQERPLTDRIWNNIAPVLDAFMRTDLTELASAVRQDKMLNRFDVLVEILGKQDQQLSRELILPAVLDVAFWQPFRSVIEDAPAWSGSSPPLFDKALLQLPSFVQDWNNNRIQGILKALQVNHRDPMKAHMALATSLFQCTNGCTAPQRVYSFPSILFHRCQPDVPELPTWVSEWSRIELLDRFKLVERSSDSLEVQPHSTAISATQLICQLLHLNPCITTLDALFKLNPLVECLSCITVAGSRLFLRWSALVNHPHHDNLRAATDEEKLIVLAKEQQLESDSTSLRCRHCTFRSISITDMSAHLITSHGITTVQDDDWEFYPYCSMSEVGPSPVWIYPVGLLPPALQDEKDKCARVVICI
ncbi:hypothetical protein V5O48_004839 [Marasmius crinis-equi]|uniref:F-box domain-containing protein n=1 Tax=Marasmius crinis-equi TaxID=585013 RepID=A0ABR3FPR6_9AGAR